MHPTKYLLRLAGTTALLLCASTFSIACGAPLVPCDPCPAIGGSYRIDTITTSGTCGFQPMTIGSGFTLVQSADTRTLTATLKDPVNDEPLELAGEIYSPAEGGAEIASFSMSAQTVRPALQMSPDLVSLYVTFTGSVSQSEGTRKVSGALATQDTSSGADTRCRVSLSFSASRSTGTEED